MTARFVALAIALAAAGCSSTSRHPPLELMPDMKHQLKYLPQTASPLFSDGRSSRAPVPGTVAQGTLPEDITEPPISMATLERGQERFNIYCAVCHDRTGSGRGIVATRSSWLAGNLMEQRIRDMADKEIFDVVTHGRRSMPSYRFQIPASDRWAIIQYVRALQRSAAGTLADVPPELRSDLR